MQLTPISQEEAFDRGLPKWPQMLVTGTPVTVEQAKEIIFATDSTLTSTWMGGGNDRRFQEWIKEITGYIKINPGEWGAAKPFSEMTEEEKIADRDLQNRRWRAEAALRERAGFIETSYVSNNWASCAFIFGAHGWCHPTGMISYIDNVGKWPGVREVYDDWVKIAERWKFLNIYVTLMSGESSDDATTPVVSFHVHDGIVETFEGTLEPHQNKPLERNFEVELNVNCIIGNYSREQGLPRQWIVEFAERIRPIVDDIVKEFGL
jgi:hypothetical protein